jgi:hypothetical protein
VYGELFFYHLWVSGLGFIGNIFRV